jgi:tetratricopeptide (TPR) repeat protein
MDVACFALIATQALAQDPATLYRQGVDRQRAGDLAGAVESYRKLLAEDGTNIAARSNLGAALAGLGHYDEAVPEYEKALAGAPDQYRPLLRRNLALAYYKSGRLQDAAPILIELHESQPSSRDATLLAADCLLQLGEPAKALALLEPDARDAANDKALAYMLGIAYLKTGRTAEAQRVLDPILRDDTSAESQYALGMAMFTSGDYPAAVKALQRAVQLNPSMAHVQSYYGQALLLTGDPDGALAAFRKQLEGDQNDFEASLQSAQILSHRGKFAEAEPLARRAALLRPKASEGRLTLSEALLGENKLSEARTELEALVREYPRFGAAHDRLADVYAKTGLIAESTKERRLAAANAPKEAAPHAGPSPGSIAPRFQLARAAGSGSVNLPVAGKPTVLVFGSYTCPNFRKAAPVLNDLWRKYGNQIAFFQVYIREAHASGQWQSTINERDNIQLDPATTMEQKHGYAMSCQRKLHLGFPAVVDGLDDAAEKAYAAWPSRVFVIGPDGKIRYSSALIEEEFDRAKLEAEVKTAGNPGRSRASK